MIKSNPIKNNSLDKLKLPKSKKDLYHLSPHYINNYNHKKIPLPNSTKLRHQLLIEEKVSHIV